MENINLLIKGSFLFLVGQSLVFYQINGQFFWETAKEYPVNAPHNYDERIEYLGKININQCPHLYVQSDAVFLPTLLECFSASYAEAMLMKKPIITSDLGFAHCAAASQAMSNS